MHYLYGSKKAGPRRLVATFGSEQQLLAYVRWATLKSEGERQGKSCETLEHWDLPLRRVAGLRRCGMRRLDAQARPRVRSA